MNDNDSTEFLFYSSEFDIDADETDVTNPYMFGRELANWLADRLGKIGYETEVVPEDWGWCVVCQYESYNMFVGCISALDENLVERCEDPSSQAEILWRAIPVAEKSIFRRLNSEDDASPDFYKLQNDVKRALESESTVRFATREEIEEWESNAEKLVDELINNVYAPKPVSRWISVPVGLLLFPILLISTVGAASLLFDNPAGYETIRPVTGVILLLLIFLLGSAIVRMIIGKPAAHGGLFPPSVLQGFAVIFLLLPIGGLFTGWYIAHPVAGLAQAIAYLFIAAGLWRLARHRKEKMSSG